MKILLFAVATLLLASCATVKPNVYNTFDAANKSIAVGPGGSVFMDYVKRDLRENGWKISIDGTTLQAKNPVNYINPTAKYTLISHIDKEITLFSYQEACVDITICENATGEEVLTYKNCGSQKKSAKLLVGTIQLHTK